ncbi:23249_t:CDS:2 [Gigaspora rosea]|nr:23249_t:CDS:2 [Gigaspora rosea]
MLWHSTATNGLEDDLIFDYDRVENNNNEVDEYIFSNDLPFQQYLPSQQHLPLQDLPFQQNFNQEQQHQFLSQQSFSSQPCLSPQASQIIESLANDLYKKVSDMFSAKPVQSKKNIEVDSDEELADHIAPVLLYGRQNQRLTSLIR